MQFEESDIVLYNFDSYTIGEVVSRGGGEGKAVKILRPGRGFEGCRRDALYHLNTTEWKNLTREKQKLFSGHEPFKCGDIVKLKGGVRAGVVQGVNLIGEGLVTVLFEYDTGFKEHTFVPKMVERVA